MYLVGFSWQDDLINFMTGKKNQNISFDFTLSSLLGYGFQSIIILILGLSMNINLLDELILIVNSSIAIIVIIKSHF